MNTQATLFDAAQPRARTTDDQACYDAARRVRVGQYDAAIFDVLNTYRALTKNAICQHLKLTDPRAWTTVASRLSQLKSAGKLEWAGRAEGDGNLWALVQSDVAVSGEVL